MPRPTKCRWVGLDPGVTYFKPQGVPLRLLDEVTLTVEELEAVRLKDVDLLDQAVCAERMRISRPTFHRLLRSARGKIARALTEGKAIRIAGGHHRHYDATAERLRDSSAQGGNKARETMNVRIAVSASGPDLDSPIDERFGWCPYFIVCEGDRPEATARAEANPAAGGSGGAGIAAAAFVGTLGAQVVLTGSLGPNAARAAAAAGIQAFAVPGGISVREALARWAAGDLAGI